MPVRLSSHEAGKVETFVRIVQVGKLRLGEEIAPHDIPQHLNHTWWKRKLGYAVPPSVGITYQVSRIVEVARLGDRALDLGADAAGPHPREPKRYFTPGWEMGSPFLPCPLR